MASLKQSTWTPQRNRIKNQNESSKVTVEGLRNYVRANTGADKIKAPTIPLPTLGSRETSTFTPSFAGTSTPGSGVTAVKPATTLPTPTDGQEVSVPFPSGLGASLGRQTLTKGIGQSVSSRQSAGTSAQETKRADTSDVQQAWYDQLRRESDFQSTADTMRQSRPAAMIPFWQGNLGAREVVRSIQMGDMSRVADQWGNMTAQQQDTLLYLAGKGDWDRATEYLDEIEPELNAQALENQRETAAAFAEEHPVLASAASVPTSLLGGAFSLADLAAQNVNRLITGEEVDYNSEGQRLGQLAGQIREPVQEKIEENIDFTVGDTNVAGFLYNTLMSGADSLAAGLSAPAKAAGLILAGNAASSSARDISQRGGTDNQALVGGIAAGIFEALFEQASLGNFQALKEVPVSGVKDVVTNVLKSMGVNASEEAATELSNIVFDTLAMGDVSNWQRSIEAYMSQDMSKKEATQRTVADLLGQVFGAGAGGAVMGAGFGGLGSALSAANNTRNIQLLPGATGNLSANAPVNQRSETLPMAEQGQQKTASPVEAGSSTNIDTELDGHTPHQQQVIREYQSSTDSTILAFINKWRNLKNKDYKKKISVPIGEVTQQAIQDIKAASGIDTTGFKHTLSGNALEHIEKRHGIDGKADHSMADQNDIARMGYILENYDSVAPILDESGKPKVSNIYNNAENEPAPLIKFEKRVDGTYYVVEAVPDSSAKQLRVVSAYMSKANGSTDQVLNIPQNGPQPTPEAPHGANTPIPNHTIPQPVQEVNPEYAPGSGNDTQYPSPDSSVGAATAGFTGAYGQLQGQATQFHPQGENARTDRLVDVPTQDFDGRNIPKSTATVLEAEATPDSAVGIIQDAIAKGEFSFDTVTDEAATSWARRTVEQNGWDGARVLFHQAVENGRVSKDYIALGQVLLNNAMNAGDSRAVIDILTDYAAMSTASAQAMQAQRMLKKLSPEGKLYAIQRSIQGIQDELVKKYKNRAPNIQLDETLTQDFLNAKTDEERSAAEQAIYKNIASQIPATFADKWRAWRYLAMLGNPRTHVRNVAGNAFYQPLRIAKDRVASAIEAGVSKVTGGQLERTKSFAASPALYKAAWNDWANVSDTFSGSKYDDSPVGQVERYRRVFTFPMLEKARQGNMAAMELEDAVFKRITYADALAGYLQANDVTAAQMEDGSVDRKLLDRARAYAGQEALKATYQDRNVISDKVTRVANAFGPLGEAVLPFRRTPANVLVRGLEYSPAGLAKSLTYDLYQVKQGNKTAAEAIDGIAAGLTGSGLMALGAYLFAQGIVTSGGGDDEGQDALNDLTGGQNYALNLPGGGSVTLDWLAPEALPFFMGVELMDSLGQHGNTAESVMTALQSISDPMLELSMLQSLNDMFDSISYSDHPLEALIPNVITSYFTQAIPTVLGQIERTGEDTRMTTYTNKGSELPTDIQYAIGRASARIPGWDYQQIPYIDAWGRQEKTGTLPTRAFNNFLNPAYTSKENVTAVDEAIQELYTATGDGKVVPTRPSRYITVDGERVDLSGDEYVTYATRRGQLQFSLVEDVLGNTDFQRLPDVDKVSVIDDLYSYADGVAKSEVSDYQLDGWMERAAEAEQDGIDPADYIVYQAMDKDTDGSGAVSIAEYAAAVNRMFSNAGDRETMMLLQYPEWAEKAEERNVPIGDYIQYKSITAGADKKEDKIQALQDAGMTWYEANRLYTRCEKQ